VGLGGCGVGARETGDDDGHGRGTFGLGSERARGRVSTRRARGRFVGTDSGSYAFDA
jgi:hypothetical protein